MIKLLISFMLEKIRKNCYCYNVTTITSTV